VQALGRDSFDATQSVLSAGTAFREGFLIAYDVGPLEFSIKGRETIEHKIYAINT
jgi:hypothetical protein